MCNVLQVKKKTISLPFTAANPTRRPSSPPAAAKGAPLKGTRESFHTRSRSMPTVLQRELFANAPTWSSLVNQGLEGKEKGSHEEEEKASSTTIERARSATTIVTSTPSHSSPKSDELTHTRSRSVTYSTPSYEIASRPPPPQSSISLQHGRHTRTQSLDTRSNTAPPRARPHLRALEIPSDIDECKNTPANGSLLSPSTGVAFGFPPAPVHTPIVMSEISARRSLRSINLIGHLGGGAGSMSSLPSLPSPVSSASPPMSAESSPSLSRSSVSTDISFSEEKLEPHVPMSSSIRGKSERKEVPTSPPLRDMTTMDLRSEADVTKSSRRVSSTAEVPAKNSAEMTGAPISQVQSMRSDDKASDVNSLAKVDTAPPLNLDGHSHRRTTGTLENGALRNGHILEKSPAEGAVLSSVSFYI